MMSSPQIKTSIDRHRRNDFINAPSIHSNLDDKLIVLRGPSNVTEGEGDFLRQAVKPRPQDERMPGSEKGRLMLPWNRFLKRRLPKLNNPNESIFRLNNNNAETKAEQYTITSNVKGDSNPFINIMDKVEKSFEPSKIFLSYINWTFRAGFTMVFISFLFVFMVLIFAFGLFLKWAGDMNPECIIVGGFDFGEHNATLADGFSLSWTTFTTVGYGAIYTATGAQHTEQDECALVQFLCTAESFIGLLYAGMCAAILFNKVSKIQSYAQVTFSNAVCITFGDKVQLDQVDLEELKLFPKKKINIHANYEPEYRHQINEEIRERAEATKFHKCPVMRFQIVNDLCNDDEGQIIDATVKILAQDISRSDPGMARYYDVNLKDGLHPYFRRVWHVRHKLNEESPLLSSKAKDDIKRYGGRWSHKWNTAEFLQENLMFSDLVVTLTGVSTLSATNVISSKRYTRQVSIKMIIIFCEQTMLKKNFNYFLGSYCWL
mmetsp:Transcript_5981/g.8706  ORF Transcript_5981/g.8706 Transcript_5981/m.8706 type:complete len:489 (-) Transcript_5981:2049-3515(-)